MQKGLYAHSYLYPPVRSISEENERFFKDLRQLNSNLGTTTILASADVDRLLLLSPVKKCLTRLFVFPAITERAWLGLVRNSDGCEYGDFYGFSEYRDPKFGDFLSQRELPMEAKIERVVVRDGRVVLDSLSRGN